MKPEDENTEEPISIAGENITKQMLMISLTRLTMLAQEIKRRKGELRVSRDGGAPESPLVTIRARGASTNPPLFLMHPVGGSVMAYHELARYLHREQPVYAVENQIAFNGQGHLYSTVEEMAERYVAEIQTVHKGPYMLGGYSMGGLVAFEMARQLREAGRKVTLVAVIDTPARVRALPTAETESVTTRELMTMAQMMAHRQEKELNVDADELETLPPDERLQHLIRVLKEEGIVPAHVDAPMFRELVRVVRNNEEAQRKYEPRAYDGHVVLFRAMGVSPELKAEAGEVYDDPTFGWQPFCKRAVVVSHVTGQHLRVLNQPHIQVLGANLQRCIDQIQARRFVNLY